MKFFSYIFLILFVKVSFAQKDSSALDNHDLSQGKPDIFTVVEEMPEFPGGAMEMMKFIQRNIIYPNKAKEAGLMGKCFLKYVVDSSGNVRDVQVLKGVPNCKECDDEAVKVVKSMPKWKPGRQNGKPVSVFFNLPISFSLWDQQLSNKYYQEGYKAFQSGNYSLAKEKYLKSYNFDYKNADAVYNLGITYYKLDKRDSACYYWNEMKHKFHTNDTDELLKKYCSN